MAETSPRAVSWEALEHHHAERGSDWFWALGIIAITGAGAAAVFGNILFALVILLAAITVSIFAARGPAVVAYTVGPRGVRIGEELFPYSSLEAFYINEENPDNIELLLRADHLFMPLMIIPLPVEYVDVIDDILAERLPEEHMEESGFHKVLEALGF